MMTYNMAEGFNYVSRTGIFLCIGGRAPHTYKPQHYRDMSGCVFLLLKTHGSSSEQLQM
jgi:hypothetical protein